MQQETGDFKESEDGKVESETPTDDEEIMIPSQDRHRETSDFSDIDIRNEQTLANTQREDWLLPTEPLHGARPRQTGRECPPAIDNRSPMEATGDATARRSDQTLLLSPGRRISMEEEVSTPGLETHGAPGGVQAVPKPFPEGQFTGMAVCVKRILNRR